MDMPQSPTIDERSLSGAQEAALRTPSPLSSTTSSIENTKYKSYEKSLDATVENLPEGAVVDDQTEGCGDSGKMAVNWVWKIIILLVALVIIAFIINAILVILAIYSMPNMKFEQVRIYDLDKCPAKIDIYGAFPKSVLARLLKFETSGPLSVSVLLATKQDPNPQVPMFSSTVNEKLSFDGNADIPEIRVNQLPVTLNTDFNTKVLAGFFKPHEDPARPIKAIYRINVTIKTFSFWFPITVSRNYDYALDLRPPTSPTEEYIRRERQFDEFDFKPKFLEFLEMKDENEMEAIMRQPFPRFVIPPFVSIELPAMEWSVDEYDMTEKELSGQIISKVKTPAFVLRGNDDGEDVVDLKFQIRRDMKNGLVELLSAFRDRRHLKLALVLKEQSCDLKSESCCSSCIQRWLDKFELEMPMTRFFPDEAKNNSAAASMKSVEAESKNEENSFGKIPGYDPAVDDAVSFSLDGLESHGDSARFRLSVAINRAYLESKAGISLDRIRGKIPNFYLQNMVETGGTQALAAMDIIHDTKDSQVEIDDLSSRKYFAFGKDINFNLLLDMNDMSYLVKIIVKLYQMDKVRVEDLIDELKNLKSIMIMGSERNLVSLLFEAFELQLRLDADKAKLQFLHSETPLFTEEKPVKIVPVGEKEAMKKMMERPDMITHNFKFDIDSDTDKFTFNGEIDFHNLLQPLGHRLGFSWEKMKMAVYFPTSDVSPTQLRLFQIKMEKGSFKVTLDERNPLMLSHNGNIRFSADISSETTERTEDLLAEWMKLTKEWLDSDHFINVDVNADIGQNSLALKGCIPPRRAVVISENKNTLNNNNNESSTEVVIRKTESKGFLENLINSTINIVGFEELSAYLKIHYPTPESCANPLQAIGRYENSQINLTVNLPPLGLNICVKDVMAAENSECLVQVGTERMKIFSNWIDGVPCEVRTTLYPESSEIMNEVPVRLGLLSFDGLLKMLDRAGSENVTLSLGSAPAALEQPIIPHDKLLVNKVINSLGYLLEIPFTTMKSGIKTAAKSAINQARLPNSGIQVAEDDRELELKVDIASASTRSLTAVARLKFPDTEESIAIEEDLDESMKKPIIKWETLNLQFSRPQLFLLKLSVNAGQIVINEDGKFRVPNTRSLSIKAELELDESMAEFKSSSLRLLTGILMQYVKKSPTLPVEVIKAIDEYEIDMLVQATGSSLSSSEPKELRTYSSKLKLRTLLKLYLSLYRIVNSNNNDNPNVPDPTDLDYQLRILPVKPPSGIIPGHLRTPCIFLDGCTDEMIADTEIDSENIHVGLQILGVFQKISDKLAKPMTTVLTKFDLPLYPKYFKFSIGIQAPLSLGIAVNGYDVITGTSISTDHSIVRKSFLPFTGQEGSYVDQENPMDRQEFRLRGDVPESAINLRNLLLPLRLPLKSVKAPADYREGPLTHQPMSFMLSNNSIETSETNAISTILAAYFDESAGSSVDISDAPNPLNQPPALLSYHLSKPTWFGRAASFVSEYYSERGDAAAWALRAITTDTGINGQVLTMNWKIHVVSPLDRIGFLLPTLVKGRLLFKDYLLAKVNLVGPCNDIVPGENDLFVEVELAFDNFGTPLRPNDPLITAQLRDLFFNNRQIPLKLVVEFPDELEISLQLALPGGLFDKFFGEGKLRASIDFIRNWAPSLSPSAIYESGKSKLSSAKTSASNFAASSASSLQRHASTIGSLASRGYEGSKSIITGAPSAIKNAAKSGLTRAYSYLTGNQGRQQPAAIENGPVGVEGPAEPAAAAGDVAPAVESQPQVQPSMLGSVSSSIGNLFSSTASSAGSLVSNTYHGGKSLVRNAPSYLYNYAFGGPKQQQQRPALLENGPSQAVVVEEPEKQQQQQQQQQEPVAQPSSDSYWSRLSGWFSRSEPAPPAASSIVIEELPSDDKADAPSASAERNYLVKEPAEVIDGEAFFDAISSEDAEVIGEDRDEAVAADDNVINDVEEIVLVPVQPSQSAIEQSSDEDEFQEVLYQLPEDFERALNVAEEARVQVPVVLQNALQQEAEEGVDSVVPNSDVINEAEEVIAAVPVSGALQEDGAALKGQNDSEQKAEERVDSDAPNAAENIIALRPEEVVVLNLPSESSNADAEEPESDLEDEDVYVDAVNYSSDDEFFECESEVEDRARSQANQDDGKIEDEDEVPSSSSSSPSSTEPLQALESPRAVGNPPKSNFGENVDMQNGPVVNDAAPEAEKQRSWWGYLFASAASVPPVVPDYPIIFNPEDEENNEEEEEDVVEVEVEAVNTRKWLEDADLSATMLFYPDLSGFRPRQLCKVILQLRTSLDQPTIIPIDEDPILLVKLVRKRDPVPLISLFNYPEPVDTEINFVKTEFHRASSVFSLQFTTEQAGRYDVFVAPGRAVYDDNEDLGNLPWTRVSFTEIYIQNLY